MSYIIKWFYHIFFWKMSVLKNFFAFLTFCKADFCSLKTNEKILKTNLTENGVCDFENREIEFFYMNFINLCTGYVRGCRTNLIYLI